MELIPMSEFTCEFYCRMIVLYLLFTHVKCIDAFPVAVYSIECLGIN